MCFESEARATLRGKWKAAVTFFTELDERFQRRSPLSRVAFGGLLCFAAVAPFSISLAQICVFTAMVAWLASMGKEAPLLTQKFPLWRPWLLFALLTLASAFYSLDPLKSLLKTRELTQIMIFYLAINAIEDDKEALWLVKVLFAATSVAVLYSLAVSLELPLSLRNRLSGFLNNPMTLGGFLLLVAILALSYVFVPARKRGGAWVYGSIVLIIVALVATLSRNAWVGIVVGMAVAAGACKSRKGGLILAAAVVSMLFMTPDVVRQRVKSIVNVQDGSIATRIYMWKSGVRMWSDRKILGFGPGLLKNHYYARYANPKAPMKSYGHLHNNVVHLAAERGALSLGAWVWAWVGYFILVIRRLRDARAAPFGTRFRIVGGLAAAAGFLSAGMFEYNFGDSEVVMLAFMATALPFMGKKDKTF